MVGNGIIVGMVCVRSLLSLLKPEMSLPEMFETSLRFPLHFGNLFWDPGTPLKGTMEGNLGTLHT